MKFDRAHFSLAAIFMGAISIVIFLLQPPHAIGAYQEPRSPVSPTSATRIPSNFLNVGQQGSRHHPNTPYISVYFPPGSISVPITLETFLVKTPGDVLRRPVDRLPRANRDDPDRDPDDDPDDIISPPDRSPPADRDDPGRDPDDGSINTISPPDRSAAVDHDDPGHDPDDGSSDTISPSDRSAATARDNLSGSSNGLRNNISTPSSINNESLVSNIVTLFATGVWVRGGIEGKGTTINKFNDRSIIITVKYEQDQNLPQDKLYMYMYNSAAQGWTKLCTIVDPYAKEVSGLVHTMTPYEPNGNALFAIGVDPTSSLKQTVNVNGDTTIILPELPEMTLHVPAHAVRNGDNLEITPIIRSENSLVIDYKLCHLNHLRREESHQVANLTKPLVIEFNPRTPIEAGGTILGFYQQQWHDIQDLPTPK